MKKCPKCNRNIPSDANICPYCGTPQPGYQPMKRTQNNKKSMLFYYLLSIVLILAPMFLTYLFAFDSIDEGGASSKETITLSAYTQSQKEQVRYQYQSLSDFSKKVTNSDPYVSKIKAVEKQLDQLIPHQEFEKEYLFQITQNNNVYAFVDYDIVDQSGITYRIEYSYDLSGHSQCRIVSSCKNLQNLDAVNHELSKQQEDFNALIQIFNGKDNTTLLNETNQEFVSMKDSLSHSNISHYGKGISHSRSNSSYSIRVFRSQDQYRLKTTFETSLKNKNFM